MKFNGLAHHRGLIPTATRQVSPGKDALCVARFAEHEPAEAGHPASISRLDLQESEARFVGDLAFEARF